MKDFPLRDLNPAQQEAVVYCEGPLLVLAGAGSGKTRVITYKYAYLTKSKGLLPSSIFTVTFTNKAADEMKERIFKMCNGNWKNTWIGTFHSLCVRILRAHIDNIGYKRDFIIYDDDDQAGLIKRILKDLNMHEALCKCVVTKISNLKSNLITPEDYISNIEGYEFEERLGRIYMRYQNELKRYNALDFDDLILCVIKLFNENEDLLRRYSEQFKYILVDEFQDTNKSQYMLLQLLCRYHKNICAVGDDDQSIYKFRGANIHNILNFEKDFPDTKIVKLEQNYRSTKHIILASSAMISRNTMRKPKILWTERDWGEKIFYCQLNNEEEEAKYIAKNIKELYLKGDYEYKDFAILYRLVLQARALEEALRMEGIPYQVISGVSFYHRKEIKDVLAYMRFILNKEDNVSLMRIINTPPRGIGASAISKIESEAKKYMISTFEAIKRIIKEDTVSATLKEKLVSFVTLIDELSEKDYKDAASMIKDILNFTGYLEEIEEDRIQNVLEFLSSAEKMPVREFLDKVALFSNVDTWENKKNYVSLLTLHAAKGLEFPVVFIAGCEEGILPYFKALEDPFELQEERRLFYVGMTRAKNLLFITSVKQRKLYSKVQKQETSSFIKDIPPEYCICIRKDYSTFAPNKKEPETSKIKPPFVIGCKVKHPTWGVGVVRDCYGEGDDLKVIVNFPGIGIKKLAPKIVNLERV
ncbi:ATP-dependent helicase [Thermodesulfovibrio yellowstonii]|uniref:DNA 3'-5' helicase n=1 Tax=Thermodesulfovibrio yellowstonii (strain ATCC 51303 / DSM 11347 / YP87) TaxID=289376 RepID=B5YHS6_THEYD|nr:UvrD-helicase domain-containing protein [Thermodesulfovibrio yellowstonii]ACI21683.1 ATP-dependent DNA helicase PcrA [Thermodesulfovibrio yellowstonii DSM 11347]